MNKSVLEAAMREGKIAITKETLIRLRALAEMDEVYNRFSESFGNEDREEEVYEHIAAKYYELHEAMKNEVLTEIMDNLEGGVFVGI